LYEAKTFRIVTATVPFVLIAQLGAAVAASASDIFSGLANHLQGAENADFLNSVAHTVKVVRHAGKSAGNGRVVAVAVAA
jgi:hypothetical protein